MDAIVLKSNPTDTAARFNQVHPKLAGQNNHPVRQEFLVVHAKKGLTCTSSCHNPHGTNSEFMIRNFNSPQDGQYLQCHKYVGTYF